MRFLRGARRENERADRAGEPDAAKTAMAELDVKGRKEGALLLELSGSWRLTSSPPSLDEVQREIDTGGVRCIEFDSARLQDWDSQLLIFLSKLHVLCRDREIEMGQEGLPEGARRLLKLAAEVPEREGARKHTEKERLLDRVGGKAIAVSRGTMETIGFLGETTLAFWRLLGGRAAFRRSDLLLYIEECGVRALPIVSLISLLIGLILAFVGAIQLRWFGAQIFIADVVGIASVRIMGAVMTGVVMAGRTGAAFAAQIGTMQVNEEIDALRTFGIPPTEFLVLPRVLALVVMMPLLCLYADLMAIIGGVIVGTGMLNLGLTEYLNRTREAVTLTHLLVGLFHSAVFGALIALAGCLRGIQCGRSAAAVGEATTSAVVTSIVAMVVATAIITFVCQVIGI